jgi:hypothetical protein
VAEVCGSGDPAAIDGAAAVLLNSIEILRADAGGRAAERAARAARFRVGADARRPARPPAADAA